MRETKERSKDRVINSRQKEKEVLDGVLTCQLLLELLITLLLYKLTPFLLLLLQILDTILGTKNGRGVAYDARIRPTGLDPVTNITDPNSSTGPAPAPAPSPASAPTPAPSPAPSSTSVCAVVNVNIYLRTINDINDYKMEFAVQITFRQKWNDPRLRFGLAPCPGF